MFLWHLRNPFEPVNRTRRSPHVLYMFGHQRPQHPRPATRASTLRFPAVAEEQAWRDLYRDSAGRLPSLAAAWDSGSHWGLPELRRLRIIPELNRTAQHVLGRLHLREEPKTGAYKILTRAINHWESADERNAIPDVPSALQVRTMQQAGHPFALFYSRMRQMHVARTGAGQAASSRWDQLQDEVRPDAHPSLRSSSEAPRTPPHLQRRRTNIWEQPGSSPSVHAPTVPPNAFATRAAVQLPPMTKTLSTDEAYAWSLMDTFLSAMLVVLHQHGWATLFHVDDDSAQFSFDYQPKQQTFHLHFGTFQCSAQSDGGICLTDDQTAAVDLAHPLAVVECKRNHSAVSGESLFAQVVAEMLGAAQSHRQLGRGRSGAHEGTKAHHTATETMFGLLLDGLRVSFLRAEFTHDYLDHLASGVPFLADFHGTGVSATTSANLAERRGRTAAVDGFLRLIYTLRTRYTTSLMRAYFDTKDRMVGLENLYY
ncbi:hypothetical protein BCR35DRAFT_328076 [Leucosporidium creatinivorum]|uniref:Uncharacterized protein n=1 Tax=Leucosporidium creatinivorum TaxID=106004 RepID=A0A1Y2G281_9BASI|nr:hypothetical protein BCR35DRAFT_328076 [Leucosporidium creatinivorum]